MSSFNSIVRAFPSLGHDLAVYVSSVLKFFFCRFRNGYTTGTWSRNSVKRLIKRDSGIQALSVEDLKMDKRNKTTNGLNEMANLTDKMKKLEYWKSGVNQGFIHVTSVIEENEDSLSTCSGLSSLYREAKKAKKLLIISRPDNAVKNRFFVLCKKRAKQASNKENNAADINTNKRESTNGILS
nr:transcription factor MYB88 [Tanacetum cinerariifolium]